MKTIIIAVVYCATLCTPAYADTVEVPTTQVVPVETQPVRFKDLDEKLKQYQLDESVSLTLSKHVSLGRVPLIPFQTFAGSSTWSRRMVGVSVRVAF